MVEDTSRPLTRQERMALLRFRPTLRGTWIISLLFLVLELFSITLGRGIIAMAIAPALMDGWMTFDQVYITAFVCAAAAPPLFLTTIFILSVRNRLLDFWRNVARRHTQVAECAWIAACVDPDRGSRSRIIVRLTDGSLAYWDESSRVLNHPDGVYATHHSDWYPNTGRFLSSSYEGPTLRLQSLPPEIDQSSLAYATHRLRSDPLAPELAAILLSEDTCRSMKSGRRPTNHCDAL